MSESEKTFVAKCLDGEALLEDIDDYVDLWHEGAGNPGESLSGFLGLTDDEYKLWAEKPSFLPFIFDAKVKGVLLTGEADYVKIYRIAARGLSTESAEELTQWLKQTGRITG